MIMMTSYRGKSRTTRALIGWKRRCNKWFYTRKKYAVEGNSIQPIPSFFCLQNDFWQMLCNIKAIDLSSVLTVLWFNCTFTFSDQSCTLARNIEYIQSRGVKHLFMPHHSGWYWFVLMSLLTSDPGFRHVQNETQQHPFLMDFSQNWAIKNFWNTSIWN